MADPLSPIPAGIEVAPGVRVEAGALRMQFSRSGGPGGQNVNKLNTKAELWVAVSALRGLPMDAAERLRTLAGRRLTVADELHLICETSRSQEANKSAVMEKLRELLVQALVRPKRRRATRPSYGSRQRRLESKRRRSETKTQRRSGGE